MTIAVSSILLVGIASLMFHLAREDAPSHVLGLVTQLCTTAPHVVMDTVSIVLGVVPLVVLGTLLISAVATSRRTRLLVDCMLADRLDELPDSVRAAAARARLPVRRVVAFDCPDLLVFAHGLVRRSVMISSAVARELPGDELAAVLAHEAQHIRRWDPLRLWIADVLARGLFLFPVVAELRDHFVLQSEIEADDVAIRRTSREALAGAIVRFANAPRLSAVPAITSHLDAHERIAHVVQPDRPWPQLRITALSIALTAGAVVLLLVLAALVSILPAM